MHVAYITVKGRTKGEGWGFKTVFPWGRERG